MQIERILEKSIIESLQPGKVLLLLGPRRVGKTFLLNKIFDEKSEKVVFWNGEDFAVHELLKRRSIENYKNLFAEKELLMIDEAQKIPKIGEVLKLIVDNLKYLKIVATGSSAFDVRNLSGEPLTGRKEDLLIFPISEKEFRKYESVIQHKDALLNRLVFGSMPELINYSTFDQKSKYLKNLINSYLLKDILPFENIKASDKIFSLLRLIAFQIGSEVSLTEIGNHLSMSKNTVARYLDLLSKVFIIFKISGFSRNLRKEVTKNSKWYFYDNGIRNALTANLEPVSLRNDIGQLWENYIISERIKTQHYFNITSNNYFWRTYDQQEIDWIEERNGKLFAYEFKWKESKSKIPPAWKNNYPNSEFNQIHQSNFDEFLLLNR